MIVRFNDILKLGLPRSLVLEIVVAVEENLRIGGGEALLNELVNNLAV